MAEQQRTDTWGLAALEALTFFGGCALGVGLPMLLGRAGMGIAAVVAGLAWWQLRLTMFAAGTLIGIGLVLFIVAGLNFARPDF